MFIYLSLFTLTLTTSTPSTPLHQLEADLKSSLATLSSIHSKLTQLNKEARVLHIKSTKTISQLKKSTDVAIYEMFNNEIQRKFSLAESMIKGANKSLKEGSVPKRIEKVLDFYVKRQQVPDPEMHIYLVQLERKIGELASHVKKVYNLDRVNLALIGIGVGLVAVYKNVRVSEKEHKL